MRVITSKKCPICGETITVTINEIVKEKKIDARRPWIDVFDGDAHLAERFISGVCSPCWDKLFPS